MPLDDELPAAPGNTNDASEAPAEAQFSTTFDASLLADVSGMNDPIPAGTKVFRLDSWVKEIKDSQPRFVILWKCQDEPNTGRTLRAYVNWVSDDIFAAAMDKSNIRHQEAKDAIRKRLPQAKDIMAAAGFKPSGAFDFEKDFLSMHPEVKIPVTVSERKNKDERETIDGMANPDFGKYTIATGQMQNGLPNAYLAVNRPG